MELDRPVRQVAGRSPLCNNAVPLGNPRRGRCKKNRIVGKRHQGIYEVIRIQRTGSSARILGRVQPLPLIAEAGSDIGPIAFSPGTGIESGKVGRAPDLS